MSDRSYRPSYGENNKRGPYYRDDARDPRQRSISAGDEKSPKEWRPIDRYRPERSPNQSPTEYTRRRNSSESIGGPVGSERSGLKELQDEQDKGYSRKLPLRPVSPVTTRKGTARTEVLSTQQNPSGLMIGKDISDPFICSLLDDGGRPCDQHFSGNDRVSHFKQHITTRHKNLHPGAFETVNGRGRFTSSLQRNPPPSDTESTLESLNVLSSPLLSPDPTTPVSLGRSSLKRRQESAAIPNEESPTIKRSRAAQDEQSVEKPWDWDEWAASLRANLALRRNEPTQSMVPMEEVSTASRASSRSPPPPPPPLESPPTPRAVPTQLPPPSFIKRESLVTLSMQIDNPISSSSAFQHTNEITQRTPTSTTSDQLLLTTGLQTPDTTLYETIESVPRGHRLAIIAMRQKKFSSVDIQRAFRKRFNIEFSIEMIENIIQQSDTSPRSPVEQEKSASPIISKHPRATVNSPNLLEQQNNTTFPINSKYVHDLPAQLEGINEQLMPQEETSNSTAVEIAGQFLNKLTINETIVSTARPRSRSARPTASPPLETPIQLESQSQPLGVLTSGLLNSLQALSPEEALTQLEALHASLPSLLERHRQIVREIEEEKERKKREEEQAQLAAEIAEQERLLEENTRELKERERAIREKNEQLTRLREKLKQRQTSVTATSSKGSTPVAENKMSSESGSREGSQQRQSNEEDVVMETSTPENLSLKPTHAPNDTAQPENTNKSLPSNEESTRVLEEMVVEFPQEKPIAMAIQSGAKSRESALENGPVDDMSPDPVTNDEPIIEETATEALVTEELGVEPMDTEEEPFSMIQVASPEGVDRMEETDIHVVGLGMETDIQVVGSGGMTFALPDYASDNESRQSDGMHLDIPLQDRIDHDDEITVDEKQSFSTHDSRSPSIEQQLSPFQNMSEDQNTRRRVTFTELPDDAKVTFPPRRVSFSAEKTTIFSQGEHVDDNYRRSMSLGARISTPPIDRPFTPPTSSAGTRQTHGVVPPVNYLKVSDSSTVLVTNQFRDWSNYFVALCHDGDIDLLDSKEHGSLGSPPLLWKQEYTASAAINGAWIAPGELALVHADSRRNRAETEVTLVKYTHRAKSRWIKPRVTHLNPCPHGYNEKITAVEPLWEGRDGKRVFATGGDKGKLFSWSVASDSSVNVSTVHKNFEKFKIAALAYLPESSLLFGAAKRRICITDIVSGKDVRQVLLEFELNDILSMSHNPYNEQETMIGLRHKEMPLALLDRRVSKKQGIVKTFEFVSDLSALPQWNHSGTWCPHRDSYFVLGGQGRVHIWDTRYTTRTPVASVNLGLGFRKMIHCTRFIENELVAVTSKELAWAKLESI